MSDRDQHLVFVDGHAPVGGFGERKPRYTMPRNVPDNSLTRTKRILELHQRIRAKLANRPDFAQQTENNKAITRRAQMVRDIQTMERQLLDPMDLQCPFELKKRIRIAKTGLLIFDEYCLRKSEFIPRILDFTRVAAILIFLLALLAGCAVPTSNHSTPPDTGLLPLTNSDGTLMNIPDGITGDPLAGPPAFDDPPTPVPLSVIHAVNDKRVPGRDFETNQFGEWHNSKAGEFWLNHYRTNR